jgi:hypothetical protein
VGSGVDGVVFATQVIGRVVHLHGLHPVNCVIRNDNRVAFHIREDVVAMANVELF